MLAVPRDQSLAELFEQALPGLSSEEVWADLDPSERASPYTVVGVATQWVLARLGFGAIHDQELHSFSDLIEAIAAKGDDAADDIVVGGCLELLDPKSAESQRLIAWMGPKTRALLSWVE